MKKLFLLLSITLISLVSLAQAESPDTITEVKDSLISVTNFSTIDTIDFEAADPIERSGS